MVIKKKKEHGSSDLFTLDNDVWQRNRSVHIVSNGTMRAWACRNASSPLLAVLPDQRQARDFTADSETLRLFDSIHMLPEIGFAEDETRIEALKIARGETLEKFKSRGGVLVATPAALLAPFAFSKNTMRFNRGDVIKRDILIEWLQSSGYEKSDLVWSPGQYASRGSTVDIYSPSDNYPLRLEFFDDEIESLRYFIPETQKSVDIAESAVIKSLRLSKGAEFPNYVPSDARVIYFEPKGLDMSAENAEWLWNCLDQEKKELIHWNSWENVYSVLAAYPRIRASKDISAASVKLPMRQFPLFKGKMRDIERYAKDLALQGYEVRVFSEAEGTIEWAEANGFSSERSTITDGFIDFGERKAFISDLEMHGATVSRHRREQRAPSDWGVGLIPGQWVVHDDYGVARYLGPETIKGPEGEQEYLVLEYADERRLLIPVMQFFKISPWAPIPGQEPAADNLKSSKWKKASEKAREQAEKAVKELMSIYAARELEQGYKFAESRDLMKELEKSFTYVETRDQLRAISDVERDMEKPIPMDRLVVGDVGFGKTEVAIRAAGKAVFSGKQVSIMAPTTLLAQQHYETFSSRFSGLPVRVEVVSRFVPVSAQKKILADLAEGKVDILIGTHRLLTPDVVFKDLGLVIIDEEHRFGVMHKEHMKKLKPGVDVLMLSATPIPRSLSLSLSGLRELSVLDTPPQSRLPIVTVVRPWSEELVKNAVLREKNRGGRVFFVHNRINDIQERATMLRRLFPKLKIGVAHSRMSEAALEKAMSRFSLGELDILICTTIVESGLDIPSANTLIVDDSHELGLAQMYQLRGRVGRREEQAYAFLFYPPDVKLTEEASQRLEAISQLDELGAGYKLAQRDLQIRGGGDLIGISQHGNSFRVGFQKYCDLLAEEIAKLKGEAKSHVQVEIAFPATIPGDYLPQENLRVTLYRRLLKAESTEETADLFEETADRFGKMPASLRFLFDVTFIRTAAPDLGIVKLLISKGETVIQGVPEGEWEKIKLPPKWFRRLDGFLGPGGFGGVKTMSEVLQKHYGFNLIE
jgi:transcription-repair coupling factor (superfamily II helicase)